MKSERHFFYRYTDLPSLIHTLVYRQLTLLDPQSWDDKNDSYFLSTYKDKKGLKSVLALCFTEASETYHHWRVFSSGSAGICVKFKANELESAIKKIPSLKFKPVEYLTLKELKSKGIGISKLPFIKRAPFKPENEVRLLWESNSDELASYPVPFPLSAISRITLSPWLHPSLDKEVKVLLKKIEGCEKLKIYRSTLISNADWMKHGADAK